jgi:hypothetical protein
VECSGFKRSRTRQPINNEAGLGLGGRDGSTQGLRQRLIDLGKAEASGGFGKSPTSVALQKRGERSDRFWFGLPIRPIVLNAHLLDSGLKRLESTLFDDEIRLGRLFGIDGQLDLAVIEKGPGETEKASMDANVPRSFVGGKLLLLEKCLAEPVQGDEPV